MQLKGLILEGFDPGASERDVLESYHKRMLIKKTMGINGRRWDVQPRFDPTPFVG